MSIIKFKNESLFPSSLFPSYNSLWDNILDNDLFNKGLELGTRIPAMNLTETDTEYQYEVAVPGYQKEDFKIEVSDNILSISSEKEEEKEEKDDKKFTRKEFSYSSFKRSFQLHENANQEKITAEYKDGILKLIIEKSEPTEIKKKKEIEIS